MQSTAIMISFIQTEGGNRLQKAEWQDHALSRRKIQAWYHFRSAFGAYSVPMTSALLTVQWLSSQKGMQWVPFIYTASLFNCSWLA